MSNSCGVFLQQRRSHQHVFIIYKKSFRTLLRIRRTKLYSICTNKDCWRWNWLMVRAELMKNAKSFIYLGYLRQAILGKLYRKQRLSFLVHTVFGAQRGFVQRYTTWGDLNSYLAKIMTVWNTDPTSFGQHAHGIELRLTIVDFSSLTWVDVRESVTFGEMSSCTCIKHQGSSQEDDRTLSNVHSSGSSWNDHGSLHLEYGWINYDFPKVFYVGPAGKPARPVHELARPILTG